MSQPKDGYRSIFVHPDGNPVYENWKGSIDKWVTVPVYRHDEKSTDKQIVEWILDRIKCDIFTVTDKPMHLTEPHSVSFPVGKSCVTEIAVSCLKARIQGLTEGAYQIDRKYLFRGRCVQ